MNGKNRQTTPAESARSYRSLALVFCGLVLIMLAYEYTKELLFRGLASWESHAVTILVTAVMGTFAGHVLMRRTDRINWQLGFYIDELRKTRDEVQVKEDMYRSLVESTGDSIYVVDRDTRYVFMNQRHRERMGLSTAEYLGKEYGAFHSSEDSQEFAKQVERVFETGGISQHEHRSQKDDRVFLRAFNPVLDSFGKIMAVTVVSRDISRLKELEGSLRALTLTDALTGLYNRRGLFALAEQQMRLVGRIRKRLCVLYIDMDNLKEINDRLGHQKGDDAIIMTAKILRETYRESDTISRIGGDEFVVTIMTEETNSADAIRGRLQKNLDLYNGKAYGDYTLSLSSGVAYFDPDHPVSLDALLMEADRLMYIHKRSKKQSRTPLGGGSTK